MKIKLTAEQKAKMEAIFNNMNELSEDNLVASDSVISDDDASY